MLRNTLLWCSRNSWMAERFPRYGFVKRAVRRFMPGEEAEDALRETERLGEKGITTVLTLLGENISGEEEASAVTDHYRSVLNEIEGRLLQAEVSVKLTQLGLDLGTDVAARMLDAIVTQAADFDNFVWVDVEDSSYVDRTLDIFEAARRKHENVGLCLQAYLYRTPVDLERLLPLKPAIRLVKGAYLESPEVAYPKKADVDEKYFELACVLLDASRDGARVGIATHDPALIERVQDEAERKGIGKEAYEFQMLYGIATARQLELAERGHRMRVLISYGSAWFPWYVRRLAERPANLWFVARSTVMR